MTGDKVSFIIMTGCHLFVFMYKRGSLRMPSERFLRLPRDKQEIIWNAAIEEFSREPFEKVSINKIIQKAGISRGSFYTYFEDKRDLFHYILQNTKDQWLGFCISHLKTHDGDFWGMLRELMRRAVIFCGENNLVQLHQNMMMYPGSSFLNCPSDAVVKKELYPLYENADCRTFREDSFEFFSYVLEQTLMSAVVTIARFYKEPGKRTQVVEELERRLQIIQYGACEASQSMNGGVKEDE